MIKTLLLLIILTPLSDQASVGMLKNGVAPRADAVPSLRFPDLEHSNIVSNIRHAKAWAKSRAEGGTPALQLLVCPAFCRLLTLQIAGRQLQLWNQLFTRLARLVMASQHGTHQLAAVLLRTFCLIHDTSKP
ncbi:MAG: hypothetical protein JKY27_14260 [Magnetovibrio sp.]|nr:hypothetical protein [Magnetovibrio sp.]